MDSDLVMIGKVSSPCRGAGEVRVFPLTDFPERFLDLREVVLVREGSNNRVLTIERAEPKGRFVLLKFAEIHTRSEAQELVGSTLQIPEEKLVPLPEGTYYIFQLIGLKVVSEQGEVLGEVADVLSLPANDVYVLKKEDKELLIPATEEVVKRIDLRKGEMVVSPIPGLLD